MLDRLLERFVISQERIADALYGLTEAYANGIHPIPAPIANGDDLEVKPKRTRRTAEQMAADAAPAPYAVIPVTAVPLNPVVVPAQPAIPIEEMRASVIRLGNEGAEGRGAAVNLLTKFGIKKASDAPPEQWAAIKDAMDTEYVKLTGGGLA